MLGLAHYEAGMCGCGCGLPRVVAHDPEAVLATQPVTCHARKWLAVAQRDAETKRVPIAKREPNWQQTLGQPQPGDGELWTVYEHNPTPMTPGGSHD